MRTQILPTTITAANRIMFITTSISQIGSVGSTESTETIGITISTSSKSARFIHSTAAEALVAAESSLATSESVLAILIESALMFTSEALLSVLALAA